MNLLYFTNSYPYGLGEQWKANELRVLVNEFDKIIVIPFSYEGNIDNPKSLPPGVELAGPLFPIKPKSISKKDLFTVLFHAKAPVFIKEFFRKRVYRKKAWVASWIVGSIEAIRLINNKLLQQLLSKANKETVLYFYWGKGSCQVLPFTATDRFGKVFVRMHRYDLFESENGGYIPYRKQLLDAISIAAPSSIAGQKELLSLYPNSKANIEVVRCGTAGNGKLTAASQDGILRVVSCSLLSPVKRVHLMIESLRYVNVPILWRHVGDGILKGELESLVEKYGLKDKFIFEGIIDSRKVLDFYTNNTFDLFINTSASEGVPFSIMEAFSTGIPVMATNVGGTSEIVDDKTGKLLPADITPQQLGENIEAFFHLPVYAKEQMRAEVFARYEKQWNAKKLAEELAVILKS